MTWNPDQYLRFSEPRLRPAVDLLARINLAAPRHVVDLGCGAGNVTRLLAQRWPAAHITGVDDSEPMLARARQALPDATWVQAGAAQWEPAVPVDLIFSNAALNWVPEHARVFPALMNHLAPGGILAVQMPRNFEAASHRGMEETARQGPWRAALEHLLGPPPVAAPAAYVTWLQGHAALLDVWETEYQHILDGPDAVKEWTKGTWLKRFLEALPPADAARFEADYASRMRLAYPPRPDGRTVFAFRRVFVVAQRAQV